MRIKKLKLPVSDVSKSAAFFRDLLELPTTEDSFQVGWSEIHLISAGQDAPLGVHLAFNVPYERFGAAVSWLKERLTLQNTPDGGECVALGSPWQSKSVYFDGPDCAVFELIGRRRLVSPAGKQPFTGSDLSCLSEVGLPTKDVETTVAMANRKFGVGTLGSVAPDFAAIGDDEGLLIVVDPNRPWSPQRRQLPSARGLEIWLDDVTTPGVLLGLGDGWTVRAV